MARFQRKHEDIAGTHVIALGENENGTVKELRLEGRQVFETDSKREIELLRADPMVVELDKKTKIETDGE